MAHKISRRDLLKVAGGSALGLLFSPLPWKLLDDSAIWTQNWSAIPKLSHEPIVNRFSTCTLCPRGCGIRIRCAGGFPVGVAGNVHSPKSFGYLCPSGLAGHQSAFHPLRLKSPFRSRGHGLDAEICPVGRETIIEELSSIVRHVQSGHTDGSIAVLDRYPGRSASEVYRLFANQIREGMYLVPRATDNDAVTAIGKMLSKSSGDTFGNPEHEIRGGYDLEHVRTILSFGAPVLDGWGSPGQVMNILRDRKKRGIRLIQVESRPSLTALHADSWLQVAPGTELALALGLSRIIVKEGLLSPDVSSMILDFGQYCHLLDRFDLRSVSRFTGIGEEQIIDTARTMVNGPSVTIPGVDPAGGPLPEETRVAVSALNILAGAVGSPGGIRLWKEHTGSPKSDMAAVQALEEVPDQSIRLLIIDAAESGYALPIALLQKKLRPGDGKVVCLSPTLSPLAAWADFVLPTPAHLESLEDVPAPAGANVPTYALSPPLIQQPEWATEPIEIVREIAVKAGIDFRNLPTKEDLIRQRVAVIHASGRGVVVSPVDGSAMDITTIESSEALLEQLIAGGCWLDKGADDRSPRRKYSIFGRNKRAAERIASFALADKSTGKTLVMIPFGARCSTSTATVSPILSKLYQESGLRPLDGTAFINPETGMANGIRDGEQVAMTSINDHSMTVTMRWDRRVLPGIIHVAVGPRRNYAETSTRIEGEGALALCVLQSDGTWRITPVTIQKT